MNHKLRSKRVQLVRSGHTLIIGVDIAKHKHWACIMDGPAEQQVGSPFAFQNTRDGFTRLLGQIGKAQQRTGADRVIVGMEPTGHYWKALATFLRQQGITVVTVSPVHVKRAKEFDDNSPTKNDRKDAWVIARRVNDADFFDPYLPEGVYAELRELTQSRRQQKGKLNQALNQLRALFDQFFPEFTQVFADPLGLAASHLLRHYPFPVDILTLAPERLAKELSKASKGRVGIKRARQIQELAQDSIALRNGLRAARLRLSQCLAELAFCAGQIDAIEAAMGEALAETGMGPYLLSVPGVGLVTAASFLGESGDLRRYDDWRQVRKLAGLNLKENSSGGKQGRTRITKRGRPGLRSLLYQASLVIVTRNPQLKALFQHLKTRKDNPLKPKQALVAISCKLLRVLYTLVTKKRYYSPEAVLGEFRTIQLGLAA